MDIIQEFFRGVAPHDVLGGIAQIIIAISVLINVLVTWRNGRKIDVVHKATNSMKDELVSAAHLVGEAKGREIERKEEKTRRDNQK